MRKRLFSMLAAGAMIASVFAAVPGQAAPIVPAEPNIVDPTGDANTTTGNTVGPADGSTVGDLMAVWFSNTADTISVHIQTERPGPASSGTIYEVYTDQTDGFTGYMNGCLRFAMLIPAGGTPGGPYQGAPLIKLVDRCNDGTSLYSNGVEGEYVIEELGDGTGVLTATFPRSYSTLLGNGEVLTEPQARSSVPIGSDEELPQAGRVGFVSFRLDDTQIGTDYTIAESGGPPVVQPPPTDPPPPDDPPVKKGCKKKKGKGKKKGCDKGKGPKEEPKDECAAYVPGDLGAEAETVVVTDEHTAEAPLEITIEQSLAVFPAASDRYTNIQVDSAGPEAGLYVSYNFPVYEDHDLRIYYPDGTQAASVGGFNPAPFVPGETDGTGSGGHSEQGAEILDGLRTSDCQGWTANWHNFIGEGGEYTATVWLGEIQNDPAPPA